MNRSIETVGRDCYVEIKGKAHTPAYIEIGDNKDMNSWLDSPATIYNADDAMKLIRILMGFIAKWPEGVK